MLYDGFTISKLSRRSYFHRGTQYERSVCYMIVPPYQNCPQVFIFHFTSQTEYSICSCFQHIILAVISAMWYNVKFPPCSKMQNVISPGRRQGDVTSLTRARPSCVSCQGLGELVASSLMNLDTYHMLELPS